MPRPPVQKSRFSFQEVFPNPVIRWGFYFGLWTTLGLLNAASAVSDFAKLGVPAWKPVVYELSSLYTTGLLLPVVAAFIRRFPFAAGHWRSRLGLHLIAMTAFSLLHTGGMIAIRKLTFAVAGENYVFGGDGLFGALIYEWTKDVALYWTLVLLVIGFDNYKKYRNRELAASRLQIQLAEARLESLKGQLNPHFLFNTLNTVSSLMYEDLAAADRVISRLSDLLRTVLENYQRNEVMLREELEFLEIYLEIMKARFGDRLKIDIQIDPGCRDALVPNLLLQPLVENAVQHAVARDDSGGGIIVGARSEAARLVLTVDDDGPGIGRPLSELLQRGHGLAITWERLERLYGDDQTMRLINRMPKGLQVRVELPLRRETSRAATNTGKGTTGDERPTASPGGLRP